MFDSSFSSYDLNGDGVISLDEFLNAISNLPTNFDFNSWDLNGDGFLSIDECNNLFLNMPLHFDFNAADKNHDGFLSMDEFLNATASFELPVEFEIDPKINNNAAISFTGVSCLSSSHSTAVTTICVNGGYVVS